MTSYYIPPQSCCCSDPECRVWGCKSQRAMRGQFQGQFYQHPRGCICPPGSEKTCQGFGCPRKGIAPASAAASVKPSPQSAGGKARAASLTADQRSELARKAANARWGNV